MKKLYTVALFLFLSQLTIAQNPNFEWAKQMGGTSTDYGHSITTDASGNVYTTGYFKDTVDFDPGVGIVNLTSAGDYDIFIQKLNAAGNLLWVKQIGGPFSDRGYSITIDTSGNVYTTGYFKGTVDFDPGVGTVNLTSVGNTDIFIQKLDFAGNLLWVKKMGGFPDDEGQSITTDAAGNVYTTGSFKGTVDFDPGVGTTSLTSAGGRDIFIQKLDFGGNFLWVKQMGGYTGDDVGRSITIDTVGNVYTTGWFYGTVDFDPGAGITNLNSAGVFDIFIQKLNTAGNLLWVKKMGGSSFDEGYSITTDASGNVYTVGVFLGTVDFDPGTGITNLTSVGDKDIFIQKLDTAGNLLWVKQMGGIYSDYGYSITTDVGGNVYTIGHFIDIVDFDPGTGTANLTSSGSKDVFIQKLDGSGNFIWVKQMGGFSDDYGKSITTDAGSNIYTIGYFKSTVDFDPGTGIANLTAIGIHDVFIQKLSQCIPTTGTDVITACDTYTWINGITYTTSNSIATYILNNAGGCDSVVTLSLTINNSSSVADTVIACNSYFWQIDSNTYTASGIYNDTLINVVGCDSVVTLNLTINTADIRVYVYDPTITAFASGASYQWLDCNNSFAIITGETAQSFTATANGDYAVEVMQNSCVDTSVCIAISTLGINKAKILEQISIFPNPTTGKIFIEGDNIETIEIINAIGKILEQYAINNKTILIDMSSHNKGVYFIRVTTNNGVVVSKLILE